MRPQKIVFVYFFLQSPAASLRTSFAPSNLTTYLRQVDLNRSSYAQRPDHLPHAPSGHHNYDQSHQASDIAADARHPDAALPPLSLEGPLSTALLRAFDPTTSPLVRRC